MVQFVRFCNSAWGRLAKIGLGLALVTFALAVLGSAAGVVLAAVGLVLLGLGLVGRCVLELFVGSQPRRAA